MLLNLQIQKAFRVLTLALIAAALATPMTEARGEPPHLADYWEPTRLSMHACLQRAMTVLRQMGFEDAHLGKGGKEVFGYHRDSHVGVICSIPRWVVFVGASPNLDEITNFRDELVQRF